jgi:hypothetical protein
MKIFLSAVTNELGSYSEELMRSLSDPAIIPENPTIFVLETGRPFGNLRRRVEDQTNTLNELGI